MRDTPAILIKSPLGNTPVGQLQDKNGLARILTAHSGASYIDWVACFDAEVY